MTSPEFPQPYDDEEPLRSLDLTQEEVLASVELLASPMDVDNETANRYSVAGLYMPTNEVVISVLDRLDAKGKPKEKHDGDFLNDMNMAELKELLHGVEDYAKKVEYTRLFMMNRHKKWMHLQRFRSRG